jgi:hypothetical protein
MKKENKEFNWKEGCEFKALLSNEKTIELELKFVRGLSGDWRNTGRNLSV